MKSHLPPNASPTRQTNPVVEASTILRGHSISRQVAENLKANTIAGPGIYGRVWGGFEHWEGRGTYICQGAYTKG